MYLKNLIIPFTLINRFKHTKKLKDYPLYFYRNKCAKQDNLRFAVRIVNWKGMVGFGNNYKEAFSSLQTAFENYKASHEYLPFPWRKHLLQFAACDRMMKYERFAVGFFKKILNMNFYDGYFSDETWLSIFSEGYGSEWKYSIIAKVELYYGVDISDVFDYPFPELFKFIIESKKNKNHLDLSSDDDLSDEE